MKALTGRERVLIVVCLLVLAGVALTQLLSRMQATAAKPDVAALSRRRAALLRDIASLQAATRKQAISAKLAVPEALSLMGRCTRQAGVTMDSARPLRDVVSGGLVRHAVQFNVSGSFMQIVALLEKLQAADPRLVVERVELASADPARDAVQAELRLAGYEPAPATRGHRRMRP